MKVKNRKVLQWESKDYGRSIALFLFNYLLIAGMYVLTIYINDKSGFVDYFRHAGEQFVYMMGTLFLVLFVTYLYYFFEYRNFLRKAKNVTLMFAIIDITIICSYATGMLWSVYARPIALGALLALLLLGRKQAVFLNVVTCLLLFLMDTFTNATFEYTNATYSSLVIGFTSAMVGIYVVDRVKSRIKVFFAGIVIAIPTVLCVVFLEEIGFSKIVLDDLLRAGLYGLTSGLMSVVLFMAVLPIYEYMFNVVTDYRLREITDHRSPLVKRLIEEAPGTFNHSLMVSNLAENCAIAIGENSALARAAAYYHDMGKLKQPEYFAENQTDYNPHDELSPELSTDIIRSHARDGHDIILKYHLPEVLADVAREHHGTMPIRYFYAKASKFTEGELDVENFSYAGPKPQSKIAAIIMISDACEAVTRTLVEKTTENVEKAVRDIIGERMKYGQFDDCDLTMNDLDIIRQTLVASLAGMFHQRVTYPKLKIGRMGEHDAYLND